MPFDGIKLTELAPIVLTVYNRPWHTEQTLRALQNNDLADQSILYVYSDGPKHLALQDDLEKIEQVRKLVKSEKWCKEVHLIESKQNIGLVNSFVKSITEVVNKHGKVIVLEDDQITSKGFLKFLNEALEIYKDETQVMHISAYMYPAKFISKESTFFLNIQSCPGWATWKRAWDLYNHDAVDHLKYFSQDKKLKKKFDIEGHAYFFKQLVLNAGPINYSWAVRWYASCLRANGLSLFPAKSLVQNIGLDGTGVHCGPTTMYDVETVDYLEINKVPIIENIKIRKSVDQFYKMNLKKKRSISVKSNAVSALRLIGAGKIKTGLRWIMRRIYPEMAIFENRTIDWSIFVPSAKDSSVSELAKLYAPYHIHECQIGDYTYIARNSWISKTSIGKFCSIGPNLVCGWGIHPVDGISTSPMFYSTLKQNGTTLSATNKVQERKPIKIGNDVFIGMNVTILDGVTIGDGAVIGAGAVVSKDIPPYAIAVGNPIKILRYRFDRKTIEKILEIKWWGWPAENLIQVEKSIFDVEQFIRDHSVNPTLININTSEQLINDE